MITLFPVEFYTIRELRFNKRQMIWIADRLYTIRCGDWPVKPSGHIEPVPHKGKAAGDRNNGRRAIKTLKTRPARFERAAQIAAEIDWRLAQCGPDAMLFLDVYMEGLSFEKTAKRHKLDADTVSYRCDLVLKYISGWRRKNMNMAAYNQHRK